MNPPSYRATVMSLGFGQLLGWAFLYFAFTSFVLPMQRAFGWTEPAIMGAFTLGLAAWGATSYAVGAAVDRGRGREVMTSGGLLAGCGFLLWSQADALATVYAAWALIGSSMAMLLYEPAFAILVKRFPTRFRGAIGTLTLFGGFGSTLSFTAVGAMVEHLDWRTALAVIGACLACVVAPLHAWALRGCAEPEGRPGAAGASAQAARPVGAGADATLRAAFRSPAFWLLAAAFTLYAFAAAGIWAHIMPALASKGQTPAQSMRVLVWFGPAQVLGRFAYIALAARIPLTTHATGLIVLSVLATSVTIFALAEQTWALLLFSVAFGVSNGLVTIVRGAILPEYFGGRNVGRIGGAMSAITLLVRALAPLVTAWILVLSGGYRAVLLTLALLSLAAVFSFALARRPAHSFRE